jgi:hypothetical protein
MAADFELKNRIDAAADQATVLPALPDVPGLSYEEIRAMLQARHDTSVGLDDPILMLVSIFNTYLGEFEKLHDRHNQALTGLLAAKTAEYVSGVRQTTGALTKTLSEASVEGLRKVFEDQSGRLKAFENSLFWCSGLIAVSAFINAALYLLK